jgi:hypothetical protein
VGGRAEVKCWPTAIEGGLPTARTTSNNTKSKKAIHPTQIEQNECALKRRLNGGGEIRLYQPIELGSRTKKTRAAPRAISEGRVLFCAQAGKASSTIAAAAATATTTMVVVGGKQTKKFRCGNGR